jgi:hypothetical protein
VNAAVTPTREAVLTDLVTTRLKKMLGETRGTEVLTEVFTKLGLRKVETPDELKRIATELISRGGLTKMIGHSVMTEALLRGASAG